MATRVLDVEIIGCGTIFLFQPLSDAAREWIKEYVQEDAQRFGDALAVEHRFARDLARGHGRGQLGPGITRPSVVKRRGGRIMMPL